MQIINQIGHLQHWGITPALNFLSHVSPTDSTTPLKILLTGTSDIRHILKTITDIDIANNIKTNKIQIYFHQTHKELLCRALLFLHIIHEVNLNLQERIQLFLDLYGNALIKERDSRYLATIRVDFLNFLHNEKKIQTPIKCFTNLKYLKYQQRDQLCQIINNWSQKIPFDIVTLRDQKLRYLYKQRYDYRANLIDWDYNMLLTQQAPIIHFYHYKEWRLTGLAFQHRFSTYTQPNRTLSSYAPGKKKIQKTSCIVRGYWGDIVISPYIAMGIQTNSQQHDLLFKKCNMKFIGHSVELTQYNLGYWLYRIQNGQTYKKYFNDYYRTDQQGKKKLEQREQAKKKKKIKAVQKKPSLKPIKQQQQTELPQSQPQTHPPKKSQTLPKNHQPQQQLLDSQQQQCKLKTQTHNKQDIKTITQTTSKILKLFAKYNIQFYPFCMPIEKLTKPKFKAFFDVIVCGFLHSAYLSKQHYLQSTLKKGGHLYVETAQYIVPKKKQQRKQLKEKLKTMLNQPNPTQLSDALTTLKLLQDTPNYLHFASPQ